MTAQKDYVQDIRRKQLNLYTNRRAELIQPKVKPVIRKAASPDENPTILESKRKIEKYGRLIESMNNFPMGDLKSTSRDWDSSQRQFRKKPVIDYEGDMINYNN